MQWAIRTTLALLSGLRLFLVSDFKGKEASLPSPRVVASAAAVLVLQGVPATPHDGVDGVRDQLGPDVGLAEAVRDGLAEDERRHARRHRDAHRDEQDAYIIADSAEAFLSHYGVHIVPLKTC